jgi:hypothetical protein
MDRACLTMFLVASATALYAADWIPVDPADLAAKSPKVEKDAHAEVILWEVRVSDEAMGGQPHSVFTHYLKTKIFDARGAEMVSKVDIPFIGHVAISDIAGRTTLADGTVIGLKKDDYSELQFQRDILVQTVRYHLKPLSTIYYPMASGL